jgi:hypothetical protein
VSFVDTLDTKDANIPLFEAGDEVRDTGLAKLHGGQIKHHGFADKKARRASKGRVNFLEPARDRDDRAEHKRNVRAAPHANQLTGRLGNYAHDVRLAFLIEWLKIAPVG